MITRNTQLDGSIDQEYEFITFIITEKVVLICQAILGKVKVVKRIIKLYQTS